MILLPYTDGPLSGTVQPSHLTRTCVTSQISMIAFPATHASDRRFERRQRLARAAECVFANPDLVEAILNGNVGTTTFVACSAVNRTVHTVCRSSDVLLRSVASYCGGLTKATLCGLLALSSADADALPHVVHTRVGGGMYHIYSLDAVQRTLAERGGMLGLRVRIRAADTGRRSESCRRNAPRTGPNRCMWELEERLHAHELRRQRVLPW